MNKLVLTSAIAIAAITGVVSYNVVAANTAASFDTKQTKDIEKIIHDYLVNKPEVLLEASQSLQKKRAATASKKAHTAISLHAKNIFQDQSSPSFGNVKDATVTIVEFLDYQCSHCKTMSPLIHDILAADPHVKFVVKSLPIFGSTSNFASEAATAAFILDQSKFQSFHEKLLAQEKALSKDSIIELAKESGYDTKTLKAEIEKEAVKEQIKANFKLAQNIGLQGTPAFVIGTANGTKNEFIPGAMTKTKIESLIKTFKTS